jgi:hypothetical protein
MQKLSSPQELLQLSRQITLIEVRYASYWNEKIPTHTFSSPKSIADARIIVQFVNQTRWNLFLSTMKAAELQVGFLSAVLFCSDALTTSAGSIQVGEG